MKLKKTWWESFNFSSCNVLHRSITKYADQQNCNFRTYKTPIFLKWRWRNKVIHNNLKHCLLFDCISYRKRIQAESYEYPNIYVEIFEFYAMVFLSIVQYNSFPIPKTNSNKLRFDSSYNLIYYDICQCFRSCISVCVCFAHVCVYFSVCLLLSLSFALHFDQFCIFHHCLFSSIQCLESNINAYLCVTSKRHQVTVVCNSVDG